jgi:carbonic anhydrase
MEQITQRSPILKEMVENGEIMIAGAMYDVENGQVELVQPVFA